MEGSASDWQLLLRSAAREPGDERKQQADDGAGDEHEAHVDDLPLIDEEPQRGLVPGRPCGREQAVAQQARPPEKLQRLAGEVEPEESECEGAEYEREEHIAERQKKASCHGHAAKLPPVSLPPKRPLRAS